MKNNIDINRANYEEYVIDYLEGSLNTFERDCFDDFLGNNPDIKEEISSVNDITLKADKNIFSKKDNLKKRPIISINSINEDNYEEYFIANYENDLSDEEKKTLSQFLNKNPNLKQEFEIHNKLKLVPVGDVIFSDKNLLKQKSKLSPVWYSAAAALIILFTSYWFLFDQQPASRERFTSVNKIIPKAISNSLSSETIPKFDPQFRQLSIIPASDDDILKGKREEMLLAYVESKRINIQLVNVDDFALIIEHEKSNLLTVTENIDNGILANAKVNSKSDKGLIASIFNNQIKKLGSKLGFKKKESKKSGDPTYVQLIDKGLTVFNTITGSETSTVKSYNMYGELTSYQVEGREVLLSKNQSSKSSQ